ncbi:hypothetical protein SCHAM137S_04090 [Streptomyces chartreusis]
MTSSFEFNTYPARLSDAERDKALKVLRDGVAMGRLSHDTFVRRMELALAARRRGRARVVLAAFELAGRHAPACSRSGEAGWNAGAAVPIHRE